MSDEAGPAAKGRPPSAKRKPYRRPKLERLGTLTEITGTTGSGNKNDHGHRPFNKTT